MDKEELKETLRKVLPEVLPEVLEEGLGENTYYLTNSKLHLSASTPKTQLEGAETNAKNLSLRENAGAIEVYDEGAGAVIGEITPRLYTKGDTPKVQLEGTETDAGNFSVRENAGAVELYDEGAAGRVSLPITMTPPDLPQSGLAADSTGTPWTSVQKLKIDPARVDSAIQRATWTASSASSVTAIDIYDETTGSALSTLSGNTGTNTEGTVSGFVADNIVTTRARVTETAATGETTDVDYCLLELDVDV